MGYLEMIGVGYRKLNNNHFYKLFIPNLYYKSNDVFYHKINFPIRNYVTENKFFKLRTVNVI